MPIPRRILIIAPSPPPSGGMALQAIMLKRLLEEDGVSVAFLASNFALPGLLGWCGRVPGLRTLLRLILVWVKLIQSVPDCEVVHIFAASWLYFFATVCPAILVGRLLGKRTVLNYRGGAAPAFFQQWGWLAAPILRMASVITVPSEYLAQGIGRTLDIQTTIVPNVIDISAFPFRKRSEFGPRLLANRTLEKIYDLETVFRAFAEIRQIYPDATLWIAGSGSEELHLRRLATALKLQGVEFLGHVDHTHLPGIYNERDILINASTVDNFPAALLEASAAGLAVVSTAPGGIGHLYRNGTDALLTPVGDWHALAVAVDLVVQDPAMARRLAQQANSLAKQFTWEEVRMRLYAAYAFSGGGLPSEGRDGKRAQPMTRKDWQI